MLKLTEATMKFITKLFASLHIRGCDN